MSFVTSGGSYEWIITQFESPDTITYGLEHFSSGSLEDAAFDKLSVGNVIARQLTLTLWNPAGFDPKTEFKLALRKYQGERKPANLIETVPMGTYFCDTYEKSPYSEYADIVAYDALLKADVPYIASGTFTPTTDYAIVSSIASDIGVGIEPNTQAYLSGNTLTFTDVPNIGDNGTTEREMLSAIASMRGGNWIINNDGELELLFLTGPLYSPAMVTIDSNGDFELKTASVLTSADELVEIRNDGNFYTIDFDDITDATELWYVDINGDDYVDTWANLKVIAPQPIAKTIGNEVVSFDVAPTETIKGIEVWSRSSSHYRKWDTNDYATWDDIDGAILCVQMPLMGSQDVADRLWGLYEDLQYIPYTAQGVYTDPELPLGTILEIKDNTVDNGDPVILTKRVQNIDLLASCDLSADATVQAVSFYPYLSPVERSLEKDIEGNRASITANDDAIQAEVTRAQGAEDTLRTTITQTADGITQTFTNFQENQERYIRYSANGIELGERDNNFKAQLSSTELAFTGADGQKAAWISNTQLNIEEAVIQTDEKFKGSTGNWVQQVVNDHFQIKWVAN